MKYQQILTMSYIHKQELPKFIWTCLIIILIVYIHTVLKIAKDALVISHLGTETISAIKVWIVAPSAAVFTLIYIKISNNFTRSKLFHLLTWFFISYFVLFATVLYPYREAVTINLSFLHERFPALIHLLKAIGSWQYSMFYLFSEMWVTMMLSISFWQIANHLLSIEESKRFYPAIGLMAQIGMLLAGILSRVFVVGEDNNWQSTLNNLTISLVVAAFLLSISFNMLCKTVGLVVMNSAGQSKSGKTNTPLKDSLKYILSSKPVLLITALLLSYNIAINLVEGVWKKSIEVYFTGNANNIHHFISNVNLWISVMSLAAAVACVFMVRYFKWRTSALITPVFTFVTGAAFFMFVVFGAFSATLISSLFIAVLWGSVNNIFARSTKHTLFDATKEMVYIPLDDELKTKGKAAAEMVGMRFGKGVGAFMQQGLLMAFSGMSLLDLAPVISGVFLVVMIAWVFATISLNKNMIGKLDV